PEGRPAGRHPAKDHRLPQGRDVHEDRGEGGRQCLPPGGAGRAGGDRTPARPAGRRRPAQGVLREPRRDKGTPRPKSKRPRGMSVVPGGRFGFGLCRGFAFSPTVIYVLIVLNFWGEGEDIQGPPGSEGIAGGLLFFPTCLLAPSGGRSHNTFRFARFTLGG